MLSAFYGRDRPFLLVFLAAFALVLAGCGPSPLTFQIEGGTTAERQALLDRAAVWNAYTIPEKRITFAANGKWLFSFVDRIPTKNGDMAGRECTYEGTDCARKEWVRVLTGMTDLYGADFMLAVITHELGHALQLRHLDLDNVVMAGPGRGIVPNPTEADLTECVRAGSCPSVLVRPAPPASVTAPTTVPIPAAFRKQLD